MFGYRYDTETGLYYLQNRYYNPDFGRFLNADGIVGQTGELLSHNMFAYCNNNPVNMSDKNGFAPYACFYDDGLGEGSSASTSSTFSDAVDVVGRGFNSLNNRLEKNRIAMSMMVIYGVGEYTKEKVLEKVVGTVASKSNYRKNYMKSNPGMPKEYQVHHTLPQKYESIMEGEGINIHEEQYLRGVDTKTHSKITSEWTKWDKGLNNQPTAQDVIDYAGEIDARYGKNWYKP